MRNTEIVYSFGNWQVLFPGLKNLLCKFILIFNQFVAYFSTRNNDFLKRERIKFTESLFDFEIISILFSTNL